MQTLMDKFVVSLILLMAIVMEAKSVEGELEDAFIPYAMLE